MKRKIILDGNRKAMTVRGKALAAYVNDYIRLTGIAPLSFQAAAGALNYLKQMGVCEQNGTPTPSVPVDIKCNNGAIRAKRQSGLPLSYTLLDYIQSTGTQWLDTGIVLNTFDLDVECELQFTDTSGSGPTMAWGYMGSSSNLPRWGFGFYNTGWLGSANATAAVGAKDTDRHTVILSTKLNAQNQAIYEGTIDSASYYGTAITSSSTFEANTLSAYLFARNNNGTAGNNASCKNYGYRVKKANVLIQNLVPCKNASNVVGMYDLVSRQFFSNAGSGNFVAGNPVSDPVEIYTDGTAEVLTITASGAVTQTASVVNLLGVGNYKDEQEIISGNVTRKVGVKVLDGTESWNSYNVTQGVLFRIQISDSVSDTKNTMGVLCNAYQVVYAGDRASGTLSGSAKNYDFMNGNYTTLDTWKAYLATQYAEGTPVIVVYPLETETTESVAGQNLNTSDGSNVISVTAEVSNIPLDIEYLEA